MRTFNYIFAVATTLIVLCLQYWLASGPGSISSWLIGMGIFILYGSIHLYRTLTLVWSVEKISKYSSDDVERKKYQKYIDDLVGNSELITKLLELSVSVIIIFIGSIVSFFMLWTASLAYAAACVFMCLSLDIKNVVLYVVFHR